MNKVAALILEGEDASISEFLAALNGSLQAAREHFIGSAWTPPTVEARRS